MSDQYIDTSGKVYNIPAHHEIFRGGEGKIMKIKHYPNKVAKIYHDGHKALSERELKHLQVLDNKMFVVPETILYQKDNKQVVGFIMEFIRGDYVPLSQFFSKSYCALHNIENQQKTAIVKKLIDAVKHAHSKQIVIGDLNPYNVLADPKNLSVRFIDTDSYQTPIKQHSGLLLEDIRDYFHGGVVTPESDYFALSVLVFSLLTHVHPFKGIHKKYKKLADRMIQKIPVFASDPDLIVPKVFRSVNDSNLMHQFENLYINGNRFLLSVQSSIGQVVQQAVVLPLVQKGDLVSLDVLPNEKVLSFQFSENQGIVKTKSAIYLYKANQKGSLSLVTKLANEFDAVFVTNLFFFLRKGVDLFWFNKNIMRKIGNVAFKSDDKIVQYDDILLAVDAENMTLIWLNDLVNQNLRTQKIPAFGDAFHATEQFVQLSGGTYRMFYNRSSKIATVKVEVYPKKISQQGNAGIITYIENDKLKTRFFKMDNLNVKISADAPETLTNFALQPIDKNEGFLYVPQDDLLEIYRTQDFAKVAEIQSGLLSSDTQLAYTKAGIVALENNKLWLLNKK